MAKDLPIVSQLAWVVDAEEEERDAGVFSARKLDEVMEVQPLQADPDGGLPEEQQGQEEPCEHLSSGAQVPNTVRRIHQHLMNNVGVSHEDILLELTKKSLHDVVVTLLRSAPSCDRAAVAMWRVMVSSRWMTATMVLLELVHVMEDWPLHKTYTSDGDDSNVFALAATRALWDILQLCQLTELLKLFFPKLFAALLFQVSSCTQQMPEEVDTFWRGCQQEGCLPTHPNRFTMQTMKALLCRLDGEEVVLNIEKKGVWETLLNSKTLPTAVDLLAREMRCSSKNLLAGIPQHLFKALNGRRDGWEVPAMAFLAETLDCLNMESKDTVLQVIGHIDRCLQRQGGLMCHLGLRGLVLLCGNPLRVRTLYVVLPKLVLLLRNSNEEVLRMTLYVIRKVVKALDEALSRPTALKLAKNLLPLFDHENHHVRLHCLWLFSDMMAFMEKVGKKRMKEHVHQSLLLLHFHLCDENGDVAQVSRLTLLGATKFLKEWNLRQMLEDNEIQRFIKQLLKKYPNRVDEYLQQALQHLQSLQEPIRVAAIEFLEIAGKQLIGQQKKFHNICNALEVTAGDISLPISALATDTLRLLRAEKRRNPLRTRLRALRHLLHRTRRR